MVSKPSYAHAPLLPGETAEIKINLENVGLDGTIRASLDIHIIGKPLTKSARVYYILFLIFLVRLRS